MDQKRTPYIFNFEKKKKVTEFSRNYGTTPTLFKIFNFKFSFNVAEYGAW